MASTPITPDTPIDSPETLAGDAVGAPVVVDAIVVEETPLITDTPAASGGTGASSATIKDKAGEAVAQVREKAYSLKDQATDKAREAARDGQARAAGALDDVVRMIEDAAGTIDDKVGAQYGDYARRASETVAGFASTIRDKDVDDLFDDVTEFVRRSPGVAIGGAALVGFVLARLVKAGADPIRA